jgi:hypothetical protein
MRREDIALCRRAIRIHGHDVVEKEVLSTLCFGAFSTFIPCRYNDILRTLYVINGQLFTRAMFKVALLANTPKGKL